jgi:hypothetical protein
VGVAVNRRRRDAAYRWSTASRAVAARLWDTLADRYRVPGRVALVIAPQMAHALAEEPGLDPAPQTATGCGSTPPSPPGAAAT